MMKKIIEMQEKIDSEYYGRNKSIFIVDDDYSMRDMLETYFQFMGFFVRTYRNFAEFEKEISEFDRYPDVFVFDNNTGETLKGLEMQKKYPNSVVFSGDFDIEETESVVKKPDISNLEDAIKRILFGK